MSLTVSLIAVLIPLLFMGDIVGRLFREFAITLSVTILVSAVVSLTLTPMMCARILRHVPEEQEGRLARALGASVQRLDRALRPDAEVGARGTSATLLVFVATLGATVVLYIVVPKGFFPVQDTGVIIGVSEAPQTVSFEAWPIGSRRCGAHPARSGRREPLVVHRRGRHERDAEQRARCRST